MGFGVQSLKLKGQSHGLKFRIGVTESGILGGETHAMWWVEYILNAILVVAIKRGEGQATEGEPGKQVIR